MSRRAVAPRARRGALATIALLFVASGAIRLGTGSGEAIAREMANLDLTGPRAPLVEGVCQTEEDVSRALAALGEREARVAEREEAVATRMAEVEAAEQELEETLAELVAAEESLGATLAVAQTAAEDDLARLTTVYETMKPKDAAALFEEMTPEFAAGFLGRMRPEAAASVMAGLRPETAYTISVVLAARNAEAPTE